jgi:hypothetical protein
MDNKPSAKVPARALLLLLSMLTGQAPADCLSNYRGEVFCGKGQCLYDLYGNVRCSAFRDGSAILNRDGRILCGRGRCVTTRLGEVFCSTEPEGAATLDRYGVPRCQGRCETASTEFCETQAAGTWDTPR